MSYMRVTTLLLYLSCAASAHVGDRVFEVWEIPSSDLPDLHDGSLEDWDSAVPNSSMDIFDFTRRFGDGKVDPEDLAF